ncbi:hypothetical protein S83_056769, partial [Arachis hypogaea]
MLRIDDLGIKDQTGESCSLDGGAAAREVRVRDEREPPLGDTFEGYDISEGETNKDFTLWQDPTPRAAVHGGSAAAQGPQFLLHSGRHLVRRDADEGRCFLVGSPAISDLRILTLQLDEHGGSPVRVRGDLQARESSVEIPWNQIGVGGLHDGVGCGLDRGAAYMGGGGCVREERSIQLQQPLTALRQHFLCRELTRTAGFHNLRVYQSLKRLSKHEGFLGLYNSLLVNRLSGKIPKHVGNITTLTYLMLEANNFSGVVPPELGKLINLQT